MFVSTLLPLSFGSWANWYLIITQISDAILPFSDFTQTLNEMADPFVKKDKLFLTWIANLPAVFTFNKEHIKQILSKSDDEILCKGLFLYKGIDEIVPNSLLTVGGDKWKPRRKILSAPFHTTNLDNFVGIVNFESDRINKFSEKESAVQRRTSWDEKGERKTKIV